MPLPLLPLPHLSYFAVNSVDFLTVRLLSFADEDVTAASLLSSSFLRRLAIAATLLSGSFLRQLAIAAIPKIQRCCCKSPPSSSPPLSSRRFLPSTSSPSPTRMSLPPLFSLVLSFVGSPSPPLFSLVLSFIGSPSPPSPRSSAAIADLLPLPLLHHPAAASFHPPPLPRRRRECRCRLFSLWFFPSSARHRHLSSLWFFLSSAHHRRHPQDPTLPLQISSLFLSFTVQPPLLALLQRCLFSLPLLHCLPPSPPLTSAPLLPPPFAIATSQSSVPIRFTGEPNGLTELFRMTCRSDFILESDRFGLRVPIQPVQPTSPIWF